MAGDSSSDVASLRVATRGSRLALAQAGIVIAALQDAHPGLACEVVVVKTSGDLDARPFSQIGGKGLFTAEIERALVEGAADIAVHSAKDITMQLAPGCVLACVPSREVSHDVVLGGRGATGEERLAALPPGARVGTSSMRRRALLNELRDDLEVVEFRGNLDTRVRKVAEGRVDAAIVAAAGLRRLPEIEVDAAPLDPVRWVPAPGQGALAVEVLEARPEVVSLLRTVDDPIAHACVRLERAFARRIEGGCSIPLGCAALPAAAGLVASGFVGSPDGGSTVRDRISGSPDEAERLGLELAEALLAAGADEILQDLRAEDAPAVVEP